MYFILLSHLSSFLIGAYDALCHFPAFPAAVHGGLFDIPVRLRFAHVKPGHQEEFRPAYKPCVFAGDCWYTGAESEVACTWPEAVAGQPQAVPNQPRGFRRQHRPGADFGVCPPRMQSLQQWCRPSTAAR